MESNLSSMIQTSTANKEGNMSTAPLLAIKANGLSFLAATSEVLQA